MKILLIDPPFYRLIGYYNRYFPLGLSYLASVLIQKGHEVLIYDSDCNISPSKMDLSRLENYYPMYLESLGNGTHYIWEELKGIINRFKPEVVGITGWTTFIASSFKVASIVKSENRDLPVVMGGPHITLKSDEVMRECPDADFLVRGEGEIVFPELIEAIGMRKVGVFGSIRGVSFRKNGEVFHNSEADFLDDLDRIPFPARDMLVNLKYYGSEDMGLMMTSRGCPYNCSYCATSVWGKKVRYRSIENVVREIRMVKDRYGCRQFTFKDDCFTLNKNRVIDLCGTLLKERIAINWECNTRINLIDEEILTKMKKAGCNSIKVGIESGSERVLRFINKKITLDQCKNAAKLLHKIGIHWTGYFMIGLPSETKEEMCQTLQFMKELRPDYASISVYEPFPGTELFEIGIEKGLVERDRSLEDFFSISPKYYYVKDVQHRIDTMGNGEFEKIEEELKEKFHKYNAGIPRLAKRAKARGSLYAREPKILWSDFKKFLSWL